MEGLGRATKRGVRSCPCCGHVNGLRGFVCKNEKCTFEFKTNASSHTRDKSVDSGKNYQVICLLEDQKLFLVKSLSGKLSSAADQNKLWGFVEMPHYNPPNHSFSLLSSTLPSCYMPSWITFF